jgi:O-antigen/teichoic acid export membrane protein
MLRALLNSPSLRVAVAFALSGVAFAGGNLILARALSAQQYGVVSLIIGVLSVSSQVAPLGIDTMIARRGLRLGRHLRRAALQASLLSGIGTAAIVAVVYGLSPALVVCVFVATMASGLSQSAAAHFQSQRQFGRSVPLVQASNWTLVIIGLITMLAHAASATFPCALMAVAGLAVGIAGWMWAIRHDDGADADISAKGLWREALSLASLTAAICVFLNLERLVLPAAVGIEDVAMFGVLAAFVGSPFRVIQSAMAFTLLPRLRAAASVAERWQMLRHEGLMVSAVMVPGIIAIWFLGPPLAHWLLAGRYTFSASLMAATLISGVLKVFAAAASAVVTALAPESGVQLLSSTSWVCIALATGGCFLAARWGLVGVIYAVSLGWLLRCVIAGWISLPHLRTMPAAGGAHVAASGRRR